jgi:SAM-dependent methyltransferase
MNSYGTQDWEKLWEQLEQEGNVGIDHVINPQLYPEIVTYLSTHPKSFVVDFGCGTNVMGIQLLFGYEGSIEALKHSNNLAEARFNTLLYLGVEGSSELVGQANKYLEDIGNPRNIGTVTAHIDKNLEDYFDAKSIDLCTSRNFLMHLPNEDFEAHLSYVSNILKDGGRYIFATLNPDYELKKAGKEMKNGEAYEFTHGRDGEYGSFYHYYRTKEYFDEKLQEYFSVQKKIDCVPVTDKYYETHTRYYDKDVPMAFVYVLEANK